MKKKLFNFFTGFKNKLPLMVVIVTALLVAYQNIDINTYYSGWDNIHAEFDLARYARQVFFGSWLEHQGLGAPAAQAHLSEIPRLPILFFLQLLLPNNLIRYAYIFIMYLIGGIGTYLYLSKIWLGQKTGSFKNWLASLGAVFYLLHILTLQQFYISFEMFITQFAFFPFLLILIHKLAKNFNLQNIGLFIFLQLLIAPSGHTPTVFYLAVLFSLLYAFFVRLKSNIKINWRKAVVFSFLIGVLTFITNAYWIVPNLYYSVENSQYVKESRTNTVFAPESVGSIKEAGTLRNFINNTHYLFTWKHYSFEEQQFEYVFAEWLPHLSQPSTQFFMAILGAGTVAGLVAAILNKNKGKKRWAIILFYLGSAALIWIELFPTSEIINYLYRFGLFQEVFRNPFTKLSILYSFTAVVLFIELVEFLIKSFQQHKTKKWLSTTSSMVILLIMFGAVFYTALPALQGHFINDKLRIKYPDQYFEMFDYLKTQNENLRVLPLPQFSHVAWSYHDWTFVEPGNGYQGMSFNFFGMPQPVLKRDFDRWVETNDFFYHELKYALDTQNLTHFSQILKKYKVDLVIVDESKMNPYLDYDYEQDHQLLVSAGLNKIWEQDFLTIYKRDAVNQESQIFTPDELKMTAGNTERIKRDWVYQHEGDYLLVDSNKARVIYPYADLMQPQLTNVEFKEDAAVIHQSITPNDYLFTLPGLRESNYFTPARISQQGQTVSIEFPVYQIVVQDEVITLPQLPNFNFEIDSNSQPIIIFFNKQGIVLEPNQTIYPVLSLTVGQPMEVSYANQLQAANFIKAGKISGSYLDIKQVFKMNPDWSQWQNDLSFQVNNADQIALKAEFPIFSLDITQNPTVNCSDPKQGAVNTDDLSQGIVYEADKFGVACSGYMFDYLSSAASYLLNVTGQNLQGRSIKFFISYSEPAAMADDVVFPQNEYNLNLALNKVSSDPRSQYFLNWETRSFGKLSKNELQQMNIMPFPLEQFAQLRMEPINNSNEVTNDIIINKHRSFIDAVHIVNVDCKSASCYVGLDQSYDSLWLAFSLGQRGRLPHFRFNNWANMWQLNQSGTVLIMYVPELIALFSLLCLIGGSAIFVKKVFKNKMNSAG